MASDVGHVRIIGLTGGIASGKSFVAELFKEHGITVFDADLVGRDLLEPHKGCWQALRDEFGEEFFDDAHRVDRPALRKAIFSNESIRKKINKLFHPLIRSRIKQAITDSLMKQENADSPELIIVEVPLLFESGWMEDFDKIIVVSADEVTCLQRLMARDRVGRMEAEAAIRSQMPLAEKAQRADMVVDNNGDAEKTKLQVENILEKLAC